MAFNAARFGNPLDSGYLDDPVPGIGHWTAGGLAGLLASPGASVFLYSPVVAAGLAGLWMMTRSPARRVAWLLLSVSATFLLFYGSLTNWMGGRSYGSRYLVVVVPLAVLGFTWLLARWPVLRRRIAFGHTCCLGMLIQLPGVIVDYAKVSQAIDPPFTTEQRQWAWAASPLVLNATAAARGIPENAAYVVGLDEPPPPRPPEGDSDRSFSQQFAFSLDLWWLYLFYLGALPRAALWAVIIGLGLASAATARVVARRYAAEPVAYNRPV